ncbi:MAG: hydroxymethylbilane synthase [Syntrophomonadaceae bacterium]|jgi:hydroxymethylbilane synthase
MHKLIVGTRGSRLALWQAQQVAAELRRKVNGLDIEIKIIKTKGDKYLDVALSKIGDKGLFTKEIEYELLRGNIDLAVHSLKDLPSQLEPDFEIGAVLPREDPRDVLISEKNYSMNNLPPDARIGTSSLRRQAQVKAFKSDIRIVELRGNVETRMKKMRLDDLDGIILAYAGVKRLGLTQYISDYLSPEIIMPAVGQGAIAIETRKGDEKTLEMVRSVDDLGSHRMIRAERAFLRELEGGCQVPIAGLAEIQDHQLILNGLIASLDGKKVVRGKEIGSIANPEEVGIKLAQDLLDRGAGSILKEIRA